MKDPEIIKKLEEEFFRDDIKTPAWNRFSDALKMIYNLPSEKEIDRDQFVDP